MSLLERKKLGSVSGKIHNLLGNVVHGGIFKTINHLNPLYMWDSFVMKPVENDARFSIQFNSILFAEYKLLG